MADDPRAVLTDREKEILREPPSVTDSYYRSVVSTVGTKINKLEGDLKFLDKHHTQHAEKMRAAICEEGETSLRLDRDTWKEINSQREPGESLEDTIIRIVKETS